MQDILIDRLRKPTPRYTSYPTAPHFHDGIAAAQYESWLSAIPNGSSLSLYIHIPFCDRLCWFCGCTTKQTNKYKPVERYLESLYREIGTVGNLTGSHAKVNALHLGGGSPTMLEPRDFERLRAVIDAHFGFTANAEISIEMDPNDLGEEKYDAMAAFGVTRASLGVQDFDEKVQAAINRPQSFEQTRAVVDAMRARGVGSVNLDMLYGLPHQSRDTIDDTVAKIIELDPDRIALFGYAHVPWMKKHQKMIDETRLPGVRERFEQAAHAARRLAENGYHSIGMDHFARPHDTLSKADRSGTLNRNFQGYTVDDADALIGLGASSIGRLPQGYVQNTPATHDYQRRVDAEDGLAVVRGLELTGEDRMRGWLIERLMCDFQFSSSELTSRFGASANAVIDEASALAGSDDSRLFVMEADTFRVTEFGRPYVRTIAAEFDCYLKRGTGRHSVSV